MPRIEGSFLPYLQNPAHLYHKIPPRTSKAMSCCRPMTFSDHYARVHDENVSHLHLVLNNGIIETLGLFPLSVDIKGRC